MKKILAMALAVVMSLSLTACGGSFKKDMVHTRYLLCRLLSGDYFPAEAPVWGWEAFHSFSAVGFQLAA